MASFTNIEKFGIGIVGTLAVLLIVFVFSVILTHSTCYGNVDRCYHEKVISNTEYNWGWTNEQQR